MVTVITTETTTVNKTPAATARGIRLPAPALGTYLTVLKVVGLEAGRTNGRLEQCARVLALV